MTDVLKQAKELVDDFGDNKTCSCEFCERASEILPELVAKHEAALAGAKGADLTISELRARLRQAEAKCDQLKEFSEDLMFNCNQLRNRAQIAEGECKRLQEELKITADRAAHNTEQDAAREQILREELDRWRKIAIEERAARRYYEQECPFKLWSDFSQESQSIRMEQAARELGIATSDHIRDTTKMMLTAEQRAALERIVAYMDHEYPIASPYYGCVNDTNLIKSMLSQSQPAWEITEERKAAIRRAHDEYKILPKDFAVLREMLEECK